MAANLTCPACARQLSINQELTAETLVQCPVCREVFSVSGASKIGRLERREDPSNDAGRRFSSTPARPLDLDQPAANDNEDTPYSDWEDDADEDWSDTDPREKQAGSRRKFLFAVGGGLAVLALVIWAILHFGSPGTNPLIGSWRGTFQFAQGNNVPCIYRFRRDGTMIDEHVHPNIGILVAASGSYTFSNGKVDIRWRNGGFEKATVRQTDPKTIEYVILDHSDRTQIGGKATFVREEP